MIRKDNQCLYLIMRNYYFLLFLFLFYSTYASAEYYYDVEIDGVYYKVNQSTKEATVVMGCTEYTVGADSNYHPVKKICYSGNVVIPETISYNGEDYSVTHIQGRHDTRTSERPTIYGAFEDCSELISISIPKTIKEIGFKAFNGCTSLRSVYITNLSAWCGIDFELEGLSYSYSATGNPLYYAPKLYLGDELLENLIIPDDITTLKEGVFIGCNMKSVTLNKYVTGLGYDVFYNCQNLKDVYSYSPQVTVVPYSYFVANEGTFPDAQNMTLHIRERYKDNYIGTEGAALSVWNKFGKIEYISGVDFNLNYVVDGEIYKEEVIEVGETITPETAPTKDGYTFSGWSDIPEIMPNHDVIVYGSFIPNTPSDKCNKPTISFEDGKLEFNSETDGAEYHYEIKVEDAKEGVGSEVTLSSAYEISVYASKEGYNDSEKNTATLYWVNVDPTTTGVIDNEMRVNISAILVLNTGGAIAISGVADGNDVTIYNISGQMIAKGKASGNHVEIGTNLSSGDICIIKIGDRSVKYLLK